MAIKNLNMVSKPRGAAEDNYYSFFIFIAKGSPCGDCFPQLPGSMDSVCFIVASRSDENKLNKRIDSSTYNSTKIGERNIMYDCSF